MNYTKQQQKYLDSVDGQGHASALEIIGAMDKIIAAQSQGILKGETVGYAKNDILLMLKTIKAQERMMVSYRLGSPKVPEWVFNALDRARVKGWVG